VAVAGTQMHTHGVLASWSGAADEYPVHGTQQIGESGRQAASIGGRQAFFS
jgi:hypothetical protein